MALMLPNSPEFVTAFMAVPRIGAIACPLSTLQQAPELRWVLDHSDCVLLICADSFLGHDYVRQLEDAFPDLKGRTAGRLVLDGAPYLRRVLVLGDNVPCWAEHAFSALEAAAGSWRVLHEAHLRRIEANVCPADAARRWWRPWCRCAPV